MTQQAAASRAAVDAPRRWWPAVALASMLGATAALLWPTVESLVREWEDTDNLTYTHGYLIVLVSAWLMWRARPVAVGTSVAPAPRVLPAVVVLSFLWLFANRAGIEIAHQALLPLLGWTALYAAFGAEVARRCRFAFAYLYFAVPLWSLGNEMLQAITVAVVRGVLSVTGVSAYVTGNLVHIPSGIFEIAGGCSGLHYFIVAVAIAALHGEIHKDGWRIRLIGIGLAAALAMLTNWIRVSALILIGHATDMQHYLVSVDHYYFGWALFVVAMLAFFLLARLLPTQPESQPANDAGGGQPPHRLIAGMGAAALALAVGPAWSVLAPIEAATLTGSPGLPVAPGEWRGPSREVKHEWQPVYQGADLLEQTDYRRDGARITAFVAVYASQRQGKELVGYGNSIAAGIAAPPISHKKVSGGDLTVNEMVFEGSGGGKSVLHYYYDVGGRPTSSARAAQLLYGWQALLSAPVSRVVAAYTECDGDCGIERQSSLDFLTAMHGGAN